MRQTASIEVLPVEDNPQNLERRRAELDLRESEERFRQLAENIQEVFWLTDLTAGRILYVSPAYETIWGRSCAELYASPQSWFEAIHPDDRGAVILAAAKQAQGVYDIEYRIIRPDGSVRWIRDRAFPVAGVAGNTDRVAGVARDVTDSKEAEKALTLFRSLVDHSSDTFEVIDPESGRFLDVNANGPAELGCTRAEYLALRVFDLDPGIDPSAWPKLVEQMRATGSVSGEGRHRRKDGTTFPIEFNAKLVRLDREYVVATVRNITARKLAEARVREQAEMLDHAYEAIIVRDIHTRRITYWNRGAERLYGWTAAEALNREITEVIFADPAAPDTTSGQLIRTGEMHGEFRPVTKDGRKLIVSGHLTLIRDSDGAPKSALVINIDITEQKSLEAQFLRSQRMESIGALAGGVAHDLNNILCPILMSVPLLRGELAPDLKNDVLSAIESAANRGTDMVRQVLTFARGAENKRVLVQLTHLIKEIVAIVRQTFPKSVNVAARYSEGVWPVEGDPTQFHQILLNLCVNARDAMPNGGNMTVAVENFTVDEQYAGMVPDAKPGPHVIIAVSDTGTGIPREIIDKIFDPFFTTKDPGKGTGLGLSTLIGIVRSHGGFVTVDSELGRGTTFRVFLPSTVSQATADPAAEPVSLPPGHGELILVVDDEEVISEVTRAMLEQYGYRALTAPDGTAALTVFVQHSKEIKAVLTDIDMPFMDGTALAHALRKMSPQTPVIAASGSQAESSREADLKELGVRTFLRKPYTTGKLLTVLRAVLDGETVEKV